MHLDNERFVSEINFGIFIDPLGEALVSEIKMHVRTCILGIHTGAWGTVQLNQLEFK